MTQNRSPLREFLAAPSDERVADAWIRYATARIRESWTDEEFYKRAMIARSHYLMPEILTHHRQHDGKQKVMRCV